MIIPLWSYSLVPRPFFATREKLVWSDNRAGPALLSMVLGFTKFTRSDPMTSGLWHNRNSSNPDPACKRCNFSSTSKSSSQCEEQRTMEAPPRPWALGLDRSGLYCEGVVDDHEKTLDFHRKVGTRTQSSKLAIHQWIQQNDVEGSDCKEASLLAARQIVFSSGGHCIWETAVPGCV